MPDTQVETNHLATTIAEVVQRLDDIIERERESESRLGYFPALYREVTVKVQEGIAAGDFEDSERMEQLDVVFANRYLEALHQFENGARPSACWQFAFAAADKWRPLILQHLLLGMNAHINLDLGIAAARIAPGKALSGLKNDFFKINAILASLLEVVQDKVSALSPGFYLLDKIGGRTDEAVMNFSIKKARDEAWKFARQLAQIPEGEQGDAISRKDREVERISGIVFSPGWFVNFITLFLRVFEESNVSKVINVLF